MNSIRVLHTGDLHIGSSFSSFDLNNSFTRIREHESTVRNILNQAAQYDIVLLCGDIFDSQNVETGTIKNFLDLIEECENTLFFMSCGNHDYFSGEAIKYCIKNCPSNLHIFSADKLEFVTVERFNLRIYGRSFMNQHVYNSLLDDIDCLPDDKYLNLLCIHGEISEKETGMYNPISVKSLSESGFDYVALGHVHSHAGLKKAGKTFYAYCGCVEGRGFDECGVKGFLSLRISKQNVQCEFVRTCKREYICEKIDITELTSYHDVISLIDDIAGGNICRIELVGKNVFCPFINTQYIERSSSAFYLECSDSSYISPQPASFADSLTLKGNCAKKAMELIDKCENEQECEFVTRAFALLLNEFDSE